MFFAFTNQIFAANTFMFVLAQVNPNTPRTFGDGMIHMSHFDTLVACDEPLPNVLPSKPTVEESKIGSFVAENLVKDGATLQMGAISLCLPKYIMFT